MIARWLIGTLAVLGVWGGVASLQAQTFTEVQGNAGVSAPGLGGAWGDYDGDGDLDLYEASLGEPNPLYRNDGDGTFTDVAASAGVDDPGLGVAVAWADYDNDGDLDLFLSNRGIDGVSRLYRNKNDGTFTEVGVSAGVSDPGGWFPPAWGDYDDDGNLDFYVIQIDGGVGRLYRNNGNGTFTNAAVSAGMDDRGLERVPRWGDYDNDGDLDLYVSSFGAGNRLYRNEGGGKFIDVAVAAGIDDGSTADLGVAWGDYDNDGDLDLYVSNQDAAQRLYQNKGDGTFTDVATSAGVDATEPGHGVNWGDYDNDGDLDLYVILHETKHRLYRNNSDGTFTDVAISVGMDFGPSNGGSDAAWGDYDNDGDLDLYVSINKPDHSLLYRNEGTPNHWLHVKLQGTVSNRSAIGTRVTAVTEKERQMWEVDGGTGFCSQNSLPVKFGFGQTAMVDSLIIRWPSGIVQTFTELATNQRIAITEDNPLITAVEEEEGATLPSTFSLSQNFPNPFNPQTTIHYEVPEEAEIRLGIFNLTGQQMRVLAQGVQQPGQYSVEWDGTDAAGRAVASGVYVYRLEVKGRGVIETKRMALVR